MEHAAGPLIDLSRLHGSPASRSPLIEDIGKALERKGFFQVINHGICPKTMDCALRSARNFFNLPAEEKMALSSEDITRPVRYCSSMNGDAGKADFRRLLLKHYAHPLEEWMHLWPSKPSCYRVSMGRYVVKVRRLALEVIEAIMESLGLNRAYLQNKAEDGVQLIAVNGYPARRERTLGIPPHSDYSIITVLLESSQGLEELDQETSQWIMVPHFPGSLLIQAGNYLEVLSNGRYKSVVHRVMLNPERMRFSIASLHSLAMEQKIEVAKELVDEEHSEGYRESSFKEFLDFLSNNNGLGEGRSYLDTLKIA